MVDAATKASVGKIPILKTKAGPRDKEAWVARLKEEYVSLIQYVQNNKESDTDWFRYLKLQKPKNSEKLISLHFDGIFHKKSENS